MGQTRKAVYILICRSIIRSCQALDVDATTWARLNCCCVLAGRLRPPDLLNPVTIRPSLLLLPPMVLLLNTPTTCGPLLDLVWVCPSPRAAERRLIRPVASSLCTLRRVVFLGSARHGVLPHGGTFSQQTTGKHGARMPRSFSTNRRQLPVQPLAIRATGAWIAFEAIAPGSSRPATHSKPPIDPRGAAFGRTVSPSCPTEIVCLLVELEDVTLHELVFEPVTRSSGSSRRSSIREALVAPPESHSISFWTPAVTAGVALLPRLHARRSCHGSDRSYPSPPPVANWWTRSGPQPGALPSSPHCWRWSLVAEHVRAFGGALSWWSKSWIRMGGISREPVPPGEKPIGVGTRLTGGALARTLSARSAIPQCRPRIPSAADGLEAGAFLDALDDTVLGDVWVSFRSPVRPAMSEHASVCSCPDRADREGSAIVW